MSKNQLIAAAQRVCCGVSKLKFASFTSSTTFENLSFKLQSSIMTYNNRNAANIHYFMGC